MLTSFHKPVARVRVSCAARSEYAAARRVPAFFQGFEHLVPGSAAEVRP